MSDPARYLAGLRRPKLLVRAARFGLSDYDRARDLRRLLHLVDPPAPRVAASRLAEEEALLDQSRQEAAAGYSPARHVEILIALIAETRLISGAEPRREDQLKASGIDAFLASTNSTSAARTPGSNAGSS